ncbi:MAG: pre-peptidase C-terminal domain-containing protein [Treponema sp.]|nr:pre-peptidase C-terminal domain-containing protein [Treponema sp.]
MKKIMSKIATLAAIFMLGSFASAEGYISANDLQKGNVTDVLKCEDDFTIIATPEKNVEITSQSQDCPCEANGEVFTQRIKIGGAGKVDYRSISFPAKAGQKVTVAAKSSSKTEARVVNLLDAEGAVIASGEAGAYPEAITVSELTIPADGTYYITSKKSTIYVYLIEVK